LYEGELLRNFLKFSQSQQGIKLQYETTHDEVVFLKHGTNAGTHTRTSTHPYEHMYAHPISMSTFERLSRLDLEIYKIGY
jgi:hypothetical protein